jgi:hypothetical protein
MADGLTLGEFEHMFEAAEKRGRRGDDDPPEAPHFINGIPAGGTRARAPFVPGEPALQAERTLYAVATAEQSIGTRIFRPELAELRTLLPENTW